MIFNGSILQIQGILQKQIIVYQFIFCDGRKSKIIIKFI